MTLREYLDALAQEDAAKGSYGFSVHSCGDETHECQCCDHLPHLVALLRRAVEGLTNVNRVDHIGRDHAFDVCTEIATKTLADLDRLAEEEQSA